MASSHHDNVSMAVFCDFENVALGVRDAKYDKFDIKRVLERLLLKGSIVVKKAYCDWERYKGFKATMHEASFELIEIPHVRQSGKNSADIRLVVDALDLCYTKSHVNTFVIISGDSDFSPLVSKLRENAKQVIGVGVKQSTSDLLIANCDEFIFYDDLVRESQRAAARQEARDTTPAKRSPDEENRRRDEQEARKTQAVELAVETFDALVSERGDSGKIWASLLKEAIKRRKPGFNESYYGFRAFGNLLEEAQARGLLDLGRDEKSGAYVYRSNGAAARAEPATEPPVAVAVTDGSEIVSERGIEETVGKPEARRRGRGGRKPAAKAPPLPVAPFADVALSADEFEAGRRAEEERSGADLPPLAMPSANEAAAAAEMQSHFEPEPRPLESPEAAASPDITSSLPVAAEAVVAPADVDTPTGRPEPRRRGRGPRKPAAMQAEQAALVAPVPTDNVPAVEVQPPAASTPPATSAGPDVQAVRKPAGRSRRARKPDPTPDNNP
jgi:uncharacterized LabA/DUF88 family protein